MELEKEELKSYIENDSKTMKDKLDKGDFNFKNILSFIVISLNSKIILTFSEKKSD